MNAGCLDAQLEELEEIIPHSFADRSLLLSALTRRSYWHENRDHCCEHNERMEFLGDAVLGLVVGEFLYMRFPEDEEGELQKKRAALVNRTALARLARELDLGQFIRMGRGDDLSGLRNLDSVLSDTLEAIVAAVYLDGGIDAAHRMIGRHFGPLIEGISTCGGNGDFKSALQELAQARLKVTPTYRLLETWGEDHCRTFAVAVCLGDEIAGQGTGGSKREAAQDAARDALTRLGAYLGIG